MGQIRKVMIAGACFLLLIVYVISEFYNEDDLKYCQEYVAGKGNIKGDIDIKRFSDKGQEFKIGANKYGYAVFKNPAKAFRKLKEDYGAGILLIQKKYKLEPLSQANYDIYGTYGWQVTSGSEEEQKQAWFITDFMDIYENSFNQNGG